MKEFANQCATLMKEGKQIVLVSSGAQVAGVSTIDRWERKKDIHYRQALCSIGQVELMDKWRTAFADCGLHIGQLLLTKDDFEHLFSKDLVKHDSVSFDEIRIGDNDNLSALTAILWNADLLILFSDIDGVFTKNPKENPDAELVELVSDIKKLRSEITIGTTNSFGTGGMETKLEAAEKVVSYDIPMVLANGGVSNVLTRLVDGSGKGTLFIPSEN